MKNVAMSYPKKYMHNDQYIFIERSHPLFNQFNRSFPPALYIIGEKQQLRTENVDARTIESLAKDKSHIVSEIESQLNQLDQNIQAELAQAGIDVVSTETRADGEVPTKVTGTFKGFKFVRAWSYWVVRGDASVYLAKQIYADPIGHESIRTDGFAGNMDPKGESVSLYHIDTQEGLNRFVQLVLNQNNTRAD
jgi:hypothetical protein